MRQVENIFTNEKPSPKFPAWSKDNSSPVETFFFCLARKSRQGAEEVNGLFQTFAAQAGGWMNFPNPPMMRRPNGQVSYVAKAVCHAATVGSEATRAGPNLLCLLCCCCCCCGGGGGGGGCCCRCRCWFSTSDHCKPGKFGVYVLKHVFSVSNCRWFGENITLVLCGIKFHWSTPTGKDFFAFLNTWDPNQPTNQPSGTFQTYLQKRLEPMGRL